MFSEQISALTHIAHALSADRRFMKIYVCECAPVASSLWPLGPRRKREDDGADVREINFWSEVTQMSHLFTERACTLQGEKTASVTRCVVCDSSCPP